MRGTGQPHRGRSSYRGVDHRRANVALAHHRVSPQHVIPAGTLHPETRAAWSGCPLPRCTTSNAPGVNTSSSSQNSSQSPRANARASSQSCAVPTNRRSARRGRTPRTRNRSQRRQAVAHRQLQCVRRLTSVSGAMLANVSRRLSRATVGVMTDRRILADGSGVERRCQAA